MRPSYVLVDYENVRCLRTGTLTLRHVTDVRESLNKRIPQCRGECSANSYLAERKSTKPASHHRQELDVSSHANPCA